MKRAASLCAALLTASAAQAVECRLALVLALDVSSSVDVQEDALQRGGLAAALRAPEIQEAFFASDLPVALAVYEWSGRYHQNVMLNWVLVRARSDLAHAAQTVSTSRRIFREFPTAMGHALEFAGQMLDQGPACLTRTVDMSGDGQNNEGPGPLEIYARGGFDGVTVNGLVINAAEFQSEMQLITFYESEVIRGSGAFVEVADGFADYERAMRRKLARELALPSIGLLPVDDARRPG